MFWMNVAAIPSGLICVSVYVYSAFVALQLKHLKQTRGLSSWSEAKLKGSGLGKSVKRLIVEFHLARWATLTSLLLIVTGFIWSPTTLEKTFADTFGSSAYQADLVSPITFLSAGTILGWICAYATFGYFKLIRKHLIDEKELP